VSHEPTPAPETPALPDLDSGNALAQSLTENPWRLALENSGDGAWDWNVATGEQIHSRRWKEMLGYDEGDIGTGYLEFERRVHPDDLEATQAAARDYLEGRTPGYTAELRMRCKDGTWKWIATRGLIVNRDAAGRAMRMIGTHSDITERKQTEARLLDLSVQLPETVQLLQTTLASISQGIFMINADGRVITFNPRVCELLDLPESLMATCPTLSEITLYQLARGDFGTQAGGVDGPVRKYILDLVSGQPSPVVTHYLRRTLSGRTLEIKTQPLPTGGMVRTFTDVTDYVQAQTDLRETENRWKLALESTGDGVWDWHIQTGEEFFSRRLLEMYGFGEHEIAEQATELDGRTHPDDVAQLNQDRQAHFDGITPTYINEHRILCKDGRWKWVLTRGMVISRDAQGQPLRMIGTHTDITERKVSEALIWQQAHFDALTGLPNRNMLRDRLTQEIKKCRRDSTQLACLFIDLDHFKEVNDTLGHDRGDELLVQAARRIRDCLREIDTVARMGGDEFTVILPEVPDPRGLEPVLLKLLGALAAAFKLGDERVFVSASIGVTIYPLDANDIEDLLKNADQALYVAKGAGRNRFSFFTPALQEAAQARARLTHDLRGALTAQQFRVVYQPIVEMGTGATHKAEALIRWDHPTRGAISPAEFIPVAEASGLISEIGDWVFQQAALQVKAWRTSLAPDFQISVNRSPMQFQHDGHARQSWPECLQAMGLPGNSIVVEITEGLLLDTCASVEEQLLGLHDAGIQVSLDDFGTGYSSLSYLQRFDIDYLKIDQSFVRHLISGSTDLALCKAIIVMAHALGIKVIAEGVETELQRDLLAAAGCDYAQGYFFARPMPAKDFEQFLARR
jgi:diguanylate cyclase (GGDEF)-like protein/PAS domain S-box-containing protein